MKELRYSIYMLINPITKTPFYVGATVQPLSIRLSGHLNGKCKTHRESSVILKRHILIQSLIQAGMKPEICLLDSVTVKKVDKMEAFYYNKLTAEGYELLQSNRFFNYKIKNQRAHKIHKEGFKAIYLRLGFSLLHKIEKISEKERRDINTQIRRLLSDHINENYNRNGVRRNQTLKGTG